MRTKCGIVSILAGGDITAATRPKSQGSLQHFASDLKSLFIVPEYDAAFDFSIGWYIWSIRDMGPVSDFSVRFFFILGSGAIH